MIYNPILLLFISYGIGALTTGVFNITGLIKLFENKNYISDYLTRKLGVLHFGWLVKNTFMRLFNKKLYLDKGANKEVLKALIKEMTNAEVGHLIGFVFLLAVNIYMVTIDVELWYLILFFFINLVFNLYLVFLQQYNKRRIQKVVDRL